MTTPRRLECPHCHHRGCTSRSLKTGLKIRCPSCKAIFTYNAKDIVFSDSSHCPVDEFSKPRAADEMGVPSECKQKELVEEVSAETVAKALACSQNASGTSRIVGLGILILSSFILVVLLPMTTFWRKGYSAPRNTEGKVPETVAVESKHSLERDPWQVAIERAVQPGAEQSRIGSGTKQWKTGQQLMVANDIQDKLPDTVRWGIVEVYQPSTGPKQEFYVRLPEKVPINVLRLITKEVLLKASPRFEISYVVFVTAWQLGESSRGSRLRTEPRKARFWALSRLDFRPKPELTISINGVSVEEADILKAVPLPAASHILGCWIDDERGGRITIYRTADDRLLLEELFSSGERRGEDHELLELPSSDGRRFEDKSPNSDRDVGYFMIDDNGDLQTRFKDGLVWKARLTELDGR